MGGLHGDLWEANPHTDARPPRTQPFQSRR
jgi:hypothetical protein